VVFLEFLPGDRAREESRKSKVLVGLGVLLLVVITVGYIYWKTFSKPTINSVAILPFANDSNDPNAGLLVRRQLLRASSNSLSQLPRFKSDVAERLLPVQRSQSGSQKAGNELQVGQC